MTEDGREPDIDATVADIIERHGAHPLPDEYWERLNERERQIVQRLRKHGIRIDAVLAGARVAREDWPHDA